MASPVSLPGFDAPAAGFDAPMAMLAACHERVRRSLGLLQRIAERVAQGRVDAPVHEAARDVLRYFDLAAPQHHEDEERHVFPLVLSACGDAALGDAVHTLQRQHEEMRVRWASLRRPLEALAAGEAAAFDAAARAAVADYVALYERHASVEETLVFPFASARLDAEALAGIGAEMAARRGARHEVSSHR
jgi:hemerythrin-like domain-containing protein